MRNGMFAMYICGGGRDIAGQEAPTAIPAQKVAKPLADFGPGQLWLSLCPAGSLPPADMQEYTKYVNLVQKIPRTEYTKSLNVCG